MKTHPLLLKSALLLAAALLAPSPAPAAIPDAIPYQGRVAVDGVNFTGTGQFKFAVYEHATGGYSAASLRANITDGFVTSVSILNGGSIYSPAATVSFTGGGGTGAAATATIVDGVVTAITVTAAGSGYTSVPKVALTDPAAPTQLWNNAAGATHAAIIVPATAVSIPVVNGLYTLGLGDTALTNMAALPASLTPAAGKRAFVRVWFDDSINGFQALAPDAELRSVPFAREAGSIGGATFENLARLDTANTFTDIDGLTITGTGPSGGSPAAGATVPLTGPGTRMEFLPGYSAFRAGTVTGTQWDAANTGGYSTALGYNTTASGYYSTALGYGTTASGYCSTALAYLTTASGDSSTALGYNTTASGDYSTALGRDTTASGDYSTALGTDTTASGNYSAALGTGTTAESGYETVLGRYNTDYVPTSVSGWSSADRLFVIGNGTGGAAHSDALVMLKSGDTTINGVLTVNDIDGLAVTGTGPNGATPAAGATVPLTGPGTRMEFLPGYSAFRAGRVTGTQWDADNTGTYSAALGHDTTASGDYSTAFGASTTASGSYSTALGRYTTASGFYSSAMGHSTTASGSDSTALGFFTIAESYCETVIGRYNTGYTPVSTSGWASADRLFVIGNGASSSTRSDAFILYKNGNGSFAGVLTHGSDRNRKTDIAPADTAAVLAQLAALPIATWRFKDDPATHLGPMAQDFRATFQLGDTDTGIASVDADGVALAAIQELKKQLDAKDARIAQLEREQADLKREQAATNARLAALEAKLH